MLSLERGRFGSEILPDGFTSRIVDASGSKQILQDVIDFWDRQDKDTIYARFQNSRVPASTIQYILNHLIVGVYVYKDDKIVALAEACGEGNSRVEVGVAVQSDTLFEKYRRKKLGTYAVQTVLQQCVGRGKHHFQACTGQTNKGVVSMIKVLEDAGIHVERGFSDHLHTFQWDI